MTKNVIIWDDKNNPPDTIGKLLSWQSYSQTNSVLSVPRYIEDHAERLKAKYLAFIHDLGEQRIGNQSVIEHLDAGDGFSFWWMTQLVEKNPLKSPRIYDCLRLLALEEILLNEKPFNLILYSADLKLVQAIKRLCHNLRITFAWQPGKKSKKKWSLRRIYQSLPFSVQGLISLRHVVLRWSLRQLQKPQWFSNEKAIFLCSYFIHLDATSCAKGQFYSRQWGMLTKYFNDNTRFTNWIQHFLFSSAVPDLRTGLSWLRLFNLDPKKQGYHSFLETYLSWRIVLRAFKNWCWFNIVSWRLIRIQSVFYPKRSAVWLWPVLRNDWHTSLHGPVALQNCLWVELFDAVLKDMPHQKIGFYLCENQGWERAFLHAWRKYNHGEIIGVQHATVPFWHLYYFDDPRSLTSQQDAAMPLPDHLAVNGSVAWKAFAESGYPLEQLVEVEALRYLNLSRGEAKPSSSSTRKRVLILGDMLPAAMHDLLSLVGATINLLPSGYRFTLKSHPGYAVDLADYPGLQMDETIEALDQVLAEYDFALAANSTSAAVDAYQAGLPVIIGLDGANLNLSPLRNYPGVCFVSTPEELAEVLQNRNQDMATTSARDHFFYLDPELPRWKQLLSSGGRI